MGALTEMVSVVFTDLVASTAIASRVGPEAAETLRQMHFSLLRSAISAAGGIEVKNLGDGLMVVFTSPSRAVACAVGMQQALERHNRRAEPPLLVRIGISTGEATKEDDDYFGEPVVEAARLCAAAAGGQILATDLTRAAVGRRAAHEFVDRGPMDLKGLPVPVDAVEVIWEPAPAAEDVAPVPLPGRLVGGAGEGLFGFLGRANELAALEAAWKAAVSDARLQVVLVSGEPGIGKTTLVAKWGRTVHTAGGSVLYGGCEEGLAVPYQPWISALAPLVEHCPEVAEQLLAVHATALARMLPAVAHLIASAPGATADVDTDRLLRLDAVVSLLAAASAEAPILLVLDDLHWADSATLQLMRHVAAAGEGLRVVVAATYRDSELSRGHPLVSHLAALRREPAVRRIDVTGLSDQEVVELIEVAAGYEIGDEGVELAHAVRQETDGNPFFVTELLRHLGESGAIVEGAGGRYTLRDGPGGMDLPGSVREVVGERVGRLGEETVRVLCAAAVIGREFDVDLLASVADLADEAVLDVLDAAAAAALVVAAENDPGAYRFAHALIQHTLYADLSAARRQRLHLRAAQALEAAGSPEQHLATLARHWIAATKLADAGTAVEYARRAGDAALDALAPDDAITWYTQGLELVDRQAQPDERQRCRLLIGLANAHARAGSPERKAVRLQAAELAVRLGDRDLLVGAALAGLAGLDSYAEPDPARIQLLETALEAVGPQDSPERARILAVLSDEVDPRQWERRYALLREAQDIARRLGDERTVLAVVYAAPASIPIDDIEADLALALEALAIGDRIGTPGERLAVRVRAMVLLASAGDLGAAKEVMKQTFAMADETPLAYFEWWAESTRSVLHLLAGEVAEAEDSAERALQAGLRADNWTTMPTYGAQLYRIRYEQGRLDEIEDLIVQGMREAETLPVFRIAVARVLCELGRGDDVPTLIGTDLATFLDQLPVDGAWLSAVVQVADTAADIKAVDDAAALLDRLRTYRHLAGYNTATVEGALARPLARLATLLKRYEEADDLFSEALATHRRWEAPYWIARTQLDWAEARLAADPADLRAVEMVDSAIAVARQLGYGALLRRAAALGPP